VTKLNLTEEQVNFLLGLAIIIAIAVIAFRILRAIFRLIKRFFKSISKGIRKIKKKLMKKNKKVQGYKNFKGDTWYPDGTVWNAQKEEWEEADYNKHNTNQK